MHVQVQRDAWQVSIPCYTMQKHLAMLGEARILPNVGVSAVRYFSGISATQYADAGSPHIHASSTHL